MAETLPKKNVRCESAETDLKINLQEYFELSSDKFDYLSIKKKRSFIKVLDIIVETINTVFEKSQVCKMLFINISGKIKADVLYEHQDFILDCHNLIQHAKLIAHEEVERLYVPEPEVEKSTRGRKSLTESEELQFSDEHSKYVIKISFLMKVVIPLITDYLHYQRKRDDDLFLSIFDECFNAIETFYKNKDINIKNKLLKIVNSRVKSTQYSDKVMWDFLKKRSVDINTITNEFYKKIIIDIIPKLQHNRSVISYLHVVIRETLKYKFKVNFELTYVPENLHKSNEENDKITNMERLEFHIARIDESEKFIKNVVKNEMILDIIKKKEIDKQEILYYKENIMINKVQINLLFLFLSKKIKRYNTLYNLSFNEYVFLLTYFRNWLYEHNFQALGDWCMCLLASDIKVRTINNKDFAKAFRTCKESNNIHNKYEFIYPLISSKNIIANIISTIFINPGIYLPTFEESKMEKKVTKKLDYSIYKITDEVMQLINEI